MLGKVKSYNSLNPLLNVLSTGKTPPEMNLYEVTAIPNNEFDKDLIFDSIGKRCFALVYDVDKKGTTLAIEGSDADNIINNVKNAVSGFSFLISQSPAPRKSDYVALSCYRKGDTVNENLIHDLFEIADRSLTILFIPVTTKELQHSKNYIEKMMSFRQVRKSTTAPKDFLGSRFNNTSQRDNFEESEELLLFTEVLESINSSILKNGIAYKIYFVVEKDSARLEDYITQRFLVLSKLKFQNATLAEVSRKLKSAKALPVGISLARNFINIRGRFDLSYPLKTTHPKLLQGLAIGKLMNDGVRETDENVCIQKSSLNLGFLITGLPGSGKSAGAMAIINSLLDLKSETKVAVVSPTNEWGNFAIKHDMNLIKLYDNETLINLFRCPEGVRRDKFYEDLAMILASASNAGPYQNPMEKCLLNAFRKVYENESEPDPIEVYYAIEESIVKFHAKRSATGIKYTKHGENIRSALENLRSILNRVEYSQREGIAIEELINKGVVFDISNVSGNTKPYIYALLLNQIYSVASTFSTDNDDNLKLLMCLEEAQIIFKDRESTAVKDLKYRIQDFRKQGVGLMLLAHNVTDVELGIRRLCQLKLYLKQAPDVAEVAAKDLVFTYAEQEDVALKLKHLNSRVGAFNYIVKNGSDKISQDTIFIKTLDYDNSAAGKETGSRVDGFSLKPPERITSSFYIEAAVSETQKFPLTLTELEALRILFLNDEMYEHKIEKLPINQELINNREYNFQLINKRGKVVCSSRARAKKEMRLIVRDGVLSVA